METEKGADGKLLQYLAVKVVHAGKATKEKKVELPLERVSDKCIAGSEEV